MRLACCSNRVKVGLCCNLVASAQKRAHDHDLSPAHVELTVLTAHWVPHRHGTADDVHPDVSQNSRRDELSEGSQNSKEADQTDILEKVLLLYAPAKLEKQSWNADEEEDISIDDGLAVDLTGSTRGKQLGDQVPKDDHKRGLVAYQTLFVLNRNETHVGHDQGYDCHQRNFDCGSSCLIIARRGLSWLQHCYII